MSKMIERGARRSGVPKDSGGEGSNNGGEAAPPTAGTAGGAGVAGLAMEGPAPAPPAGAWVETVGVFGEGDTIHDIFEEGRRLREEERERAAARQ